MKTYRTLRLILGDQLNAKHSWYRKKDQNCLYLIAELAQETGYVKHHVQKICSFFLAMEQFAGRLEKAGHQVLHMNLDQTDQYKDLSDLLQHLVSQHKIEKFEYQTPDEYRLKQQLEKLSFKNKVNISVCDSEHFLILYQNLSHFFPAGNPGRMETFYRKMRRLHNILMEGEEPAGGRWNYDTDNRKSFKKSDLKDIPAPLQFSHPVTDIIQRLNRHKVEYFGMTPKHLIWPVNRKESVKLLNYFCQTCLPRFGQFQDAMTGNTDVQWSLYHSRLSFALNTKMLHPKEVIDAALDARKKKSKTITLTQVEGFIRQILGWREYIRGVYWTNMPSYKKLNHFEVKRNLPDFFWTGKTHMRCMERAISQSLEYAYAHHIQRLMITGNYCLLAGIHPDHVDNWYLGIYIDAIEWVELPNARGMSQFADGGMVASKPYAASGNYINKMSDYCSGCHYDVKEKASETACPFNSLYWNFMLKHRVDLERNPRTSMVFKGWDKRSSSEKKDILKRAKWCLQNQSKL